jgi:tetratricopeptide (TPR) repeat protein
VKAGCLEESTVLGFLAGTLPAEARSGVEEHLADCSACADLVTWAAADQGSGTRLPGDEGRPFVGQLQPGARVGRYQVLGAVGRGGMGEVYAAYHPDLDRRIALKVVHGVDSGTGERRLRLLREARAIARLSHPNVITVHDAGTFGDRVFIAMELISGRTIDQWLRDEPRTWQQILDVFVAAGRGLAAAHAAGVVHRDFKPQNVMIAKDATVRVMDFGLARLSEEDAAAPAREATEDEPTLPIGDLTKTGAVVGTPAYMSPEQFRREAIDARSDQFNFCVALHEALFGSRPVVAAHADTDHARPETSKPSLPRNVPGWLRAIVLRGAAPERDQRYPTMEGLLAALERGRRRLRRRGSVAAATLAVLVLAAGGWRLARGNRLACVLPKDRVAEAWAVGDPSDHRRQSIHRTFAASGRATAQTSWERLSKVLDEYVTAWSTMYLQTCEATHVRGEQSAEVLDLRMTCLGDNLDQVRALTDALATADAAVVSRAVAAAKDLTPVNRCADVALLKSAVPLPKDERTLREVRRLRRELAAIQTMVDLGNFGAALKRSNALRSEVEATGYKPLLGELLNLLGDAEASIDEDPSKAEATLREAILVSEASRDDLTAAKAVAVLVYVIGYRLGREPEAEFWARFGQAVLDRIGGDQRRLRAWILESQGGARSQFGDFKGGRVLIEKAVLLKEQSLGKDHPDFAGSLGNLAYALTAEGNPADALIVANRAVEIFQRYSDPDAWSLAVVYSNQGDALNALGDHAGAESAFKNALQILSRNVGALHPEVACALQGLGESTLAQGELAAAVRFFEDALRIRRQPHTDPLLAADTEFGLARALWDSGGDQAKARSLAAAALKAYQQGRRSERQRAVETWLADHVRPGPIRHKVSAL